MRSIHSYDLQIRIGKCNNAKRRNGYGSFRRLIQTHCIAGFELSRLVKTFTPRSLSRYPLHFTSHSCVTISFTNGGWFFVALTAARFSKYTCALASSAKASQDYVKWFVLANLYGWHVKQLQQHFYRGGEFTVKYRLSTAIFDEKTGFKTRSSRNSW